MSYTFASATILLLLITDPLGNIPIFANALRGVAPERRARVILREVLIAFALLLVFLFFGAAFLRVMNLSDLSLQIAGAVVLLLAERIQRLVGERVVMAFERLMGLILVAISVEMLIRGIKQLVHQL